MKLILYLVLGLGALFWLVAGLSNVELQTGFILMEPAERVFIEEEEGAAPPEPVFVDAFNVTSVLVLGAIAALTIYAAYRWPRVRAALIALIIFTAMVLGMLYIYYRRVVPEETEEEPAGLPPPIEERRISEELLNNPPDLEATITVVVLVILGLAIVFAVRYWLRRSRSDPDTLDVITAEAESALDRLRAGADVRDTVLRCYLEMSEGLKTQLGLVRNEGMTPREFEARLGQAGLPDADVQRLTRLFEEVRYGRHATTEADRAEAVASLEAIISSARSQGKRYRETKQQQAQTNPA